MTPRANRSISPPFHEIGAFKFQVLCTDLLAEDSVYQNPHVYGRNGQSQQGIDIIAPLRNEAGLHVGQCKAWETPSSAKVAKATAEFLAHAAYWHEQGVKRFILFVGCAVEDTKTQNQLRCELKRLQDSGFEYEGRDSHGLRRQLVPHPHIVRNHLEPANYWVEFICGKETITSLDSNPQGGVSANLACQGAYDVELSYARNDQLTTILQLWEEGKAREAHSSIIKFCTTPSWSKLTPAVRARSLRMQASLTLELNGSVPEVRRLLEEARPLDPDACMALEAAIIRKEQGISAALEFLKSPANLNAWNTRLCLHLEAGKPEEVLSDIPKIRSDAKKAPNTAWAEGMALLCLKRLEEARNIFADALTNHPQSIKLRMGSSIVRYASGISTAFSCWGHLTWPIPPQWHLVRRDDESRKQRAEAAIEFGKLIPIVEQELRRELLMWRLACLANEPDLQTQAAAFCVNLLKESAAYLPALMWARERNFEFDK